MRILIFACFLFPIQFLFAQETAKEDSFCKNLYLLVEGVNEDEKIKGEEIKTVDDGFGTYKVYRVLQDMDGFPPGEYADDEFLGSYVIYEKLFDTEPEAESFWTKTRTRIKKCTGEDFAYTTEIKNGEVYLRQEGMSSEPEIGLTKVPQSDGRYKVVFTVMAGLF